MGRGGRGGEEESRCEGESEVCPMGNGSNGSDDDEEDYGTVAPGSQLAGWRTRTRTLRQAEAVAATCAALCSAAILPPNFVAETPCLWLVAHSPTARSLEINDIDRPDELEHT